MTIMDVELHITPKVVLQFVFFIIVIFALIVGLLTSG